MNLDVIFEDNHLIAINKPMGVLVQIDQTGDTSLEEMVKQHIKIKYNKPGEAFLGVIHRLDRPVSGLVLFAKTSKALVRMNEAFKLRNVKKIYWAITKNTPKNSEGNLIHWLKKHSNKNLVTAHSKEVKDSQKSELNYKLIHKNSEYSLLEINPITGRSHQIRVQLASMDCPIVGDNKYGYPRGNKDKSICLHSRSLSFTHPVSKENITITATTPTDSFWSKNTPSPN